jgi:hypothetical protein
MEIGKYARLSRKKIMRLLTILLSFLLFFTISLAQDVSNLVLNQSIEKQIKGGETHS